MSNKIPPEYQKKVDSLESELDRAVCGYPKDQETPCSQWPVSEEGRCSRHSGRSIAEGLDSANQPTPRADEEPSHSNNPESIVVASDNDTVDENNEAELTGLLNLNATVEGLFNSNIYWVLLILFGLGAGSLVGVLAIDNKTKQSSMRNETGAAKLDLSEPNFAKIREKYRNGNLGQVRESLETLYNNGENRSTRAEALYYLFVFNQNQQNFNRALELAQEFIANFENHSLNAEVMYGAWFLSSRYLNRKDLAQKYASRLKKDFPESKWSKKLTSR